MRLFSELVNKLGTSTKTNEKLDALSQYFSLANSKDKVWVIALFSGRRPRRIASGSLLAAWCIELAKLPAWLFDECYHTVGDLADTIALLLPEQSPEFVSSLPEIVSSQTLPLLSNYLEKIIALEKESEEIKKQFVISCWLQMNKEERFVFNKLLTGAFRIGVSQKMIVNALAKTVDLSASVIAHRISGNWDPVAATFDELLSEKATQTDFSKPYPFYLAYALEDDLHSLGEANEWQAEWKWDGIRGQIIKRNNELFVWSRGEELMTDKFPEYEILKNTLPDGTVIDGEIISSVNGKPLPFALLQTRIGRKNITKKQLVEAPITFFAYDLLEYNGEDWRVYPLEVRRKKLEEIISLKNFSNQYQSFDSADTQYPMPNTQYPLHLSPVLNFDTWDALTSIRQSARNIGAEGLMLKKKSSPYEVGRKRGNWWKWKIDALTIDAVIIYAQKGSGRRSNLYTDYTFAVKDRDKLVPFAKAYSGLTDKEFAQVDAFVKRNSLEKFGPVRTVKPELVFEIAFEGIAASNRHKSGVALRFPRIHRWRKDKTPDEINTIDDLKKMLEMYGK